MEPTSSTAAGFLLSKLYYGLAALFGGFVLSFFWQPAKLKQHSRLAAGVMIGGISVGAGAIFGGAIAVFFGMNPNDANTALAIGGVIGSVAVAIISLLANFFDKHEDQDLLEVVVNTKQRLKSGPSKPTTKPKPAAKAVTKRKPRQAKQATEVKK